MSTTTHKPLGDKTPFPNRQLPPSVQLETPGLQKIAKLKFNLDALQQTPGGLLLPSARRRSLRLPGSISKRLKTPAGPGNYWDVSDTDMEMDLSTGSAEIKEEEADYDEIEYMPPKVPG